MKNNESIKCSLSDVSISTEPNKMIITGCITKVGSPSSGSPCGADGKLVVWTKESVEQCMETFVGMPLDCVYDEAWQPSEAFTGHGMQNIGYIRKVWIDNDNLMAECVVWKEKCYAECEMILLTMDSMGFSVEAYPTQSHEDDEYIYVDEFEGSGCAILFKDCAAFSDTFIEKIAATKNRSDKMNEQEKQELVKEISEQVMASVEEKLNEQAKAIEEVKASTDVSALSESISEVKSSIDSAMDALKESMEESIKASIDEVKASVEEQGKAVEEIKASKVESNVPAPKSQGVVDDSSLSDVDDKAKRIAEINASDCNMMEKLERIAKIRNEK